MVDRASSADWHALMRSDPAVGDVRRRHRRSPRTRTLTREVASCARANVAFYTHILPGQEAFFADARPLSVAYTWI
jgi:hypothetical protein